MKVKLQIILAMILLLLIMSCGSSYRFANQIPKWIENPPQNTNLFIYGTGCGKSIQEADEAALRRISLNFDASINSTTIQQKKSVTNNVEEVFEKSLLSNIKIESISRLAGISIKRRVVSKDNNYSMAILDIEKFEESQKDNECLIKEYFKRADTSSRPEEIIKNYLLAAELMEDQIISFSINNKPARSSLVNLHDEIFNSLKTISNKDEDYIYSAIFYNNIKISSLPIKYRHKIFHSDKNGIYKIPIQMFDYQNVIYFDFYLGYKNERKVNNQNMIKIFMPKQVKIYVENKIRCLKDDDRIQEEYSRILERIIIKNNAVVSKNRSESDLIIETSLYTTVNKNKYLGYCYISDGETTFKNKIETIKTQKYQQIKTYNYDNETALHNHLNKITDHIDNQIQKILNSAK